MTREEALQWLTNEKWKNANNKYKKEWNEAFEMAIEALSVANLKEEFESAGAVQGEWIEVEDYNGDVHYKCDQCGEEWTFPFGTPKENNANFCPNCGARMEASK